MSVSCYRELEVWKFGIMLTKRVYAMTHTFPKHELFALSNQLQRAVVSIPANIAEGHARSSTKNFCIISQLREDRLRNWKPCLR